MDLHGVTGSAGGCAGPGWRPPDEWTVFVPKVFAGGDWVRMGLPQHEARAACLIAAADMRLMRPGMPQWEVMARALCLARLLTEGFAGTVMLDELHRVDRIDL